MRILNGPPVARISSFPSRFHCRHPGCGTLYELESPADVLQDELDAQTNTVVSRPPRKGETVVLRCPVCKYMVAMARYEIPDGGLRLVK